MAWAELGSRSDSQALFGVHTNPLGSGFISSAAKVGVRSGRSIDMCLKDGGRPGSQPRYVICLDCIHVSHWDITKPASPSSTGFSLEEGYIFVPSGRQKLFFLDETQLWDLDILKKRVF